MLLSLALIFLLPFSFVMLYVSWPAVRNSWAVLEASPDPGGLPRYPIKTVIMLSFILLVMQGFSQIIKQIEILRGDDEPADDEPGPDSDAEAEMPA